MVSWSFFNSLKTSPKLYGRKERNTPKMVACSIGENDEPTRRRHHDSLFSTTSAYEGDIEDKRYFEPDPVDLANRIIRAVAAGEWAGQADVDDEETLAAYAALGVRIGALRREHGLSLDALALCTGMDADILFAIELGLASAAQVAQHLERIAEALGDPEDELRTMLRQFYPVR